MRVLIPSALHAYTGAREVEARGATVNELLNDLDQRFPGIRFRMVDEQDRMRPHVRFFINGKQAFGLSQPLQPADEVAIVQALSGG
jgi:sulfur-carrier protein